MGSIKVFLSKYILNDLYFYSLYAVSRENITADNQNACFQNKTQFLNSGGTDGKIHPDSNKVKSWEFAFEKVHLANLEEFSKDVIIKNAYKVQI